MESVTEKMKLTNTSVLLVVFFTTITFGLYYPIWFLKRREEINKLNSDEKLGKGVFVFVLVLFSITLLLSFYSGFSDGATQANNGQEMQIEFNPIDLFSSFLTIILLIPLVQQTFKTKRILTDHFVKFQKLDMKFSNIWTFIFLNFYLQYKINQIENIKP